MHVSRMKNVDQANIIIVIIFIECKESMTNNQTINKDVQVRARVGHLRPEHLKHACRDSITERFDNISIKNIIR